MRVRKKGQIVDIPIKRGTVVRLRESSSGKVTGQRGIVVAAAPSSAFSRAYGKQVFVCTFPFRKPSAQHTVARWRAGAVVDTQIANDLYPVGKTKRIPKVCTEALREYEDTYPSLARKKRSRR